MKLPRLALVSGASSGFGGAIAERFISSGTAVVGIGRGEDRLMRLKENYGSYFFPFVWMFATKIRYLFTQADLH